jgi:hypothetical protein
MSGFGRWAAAKRPYLKEYNTGAGGPRSLQMRRDRLHHHQEMAMRIPHRFVLLALVLLLAVETGYSTMRVTQEKISVSRALAGHVLVRGTDEPASGVTVELCSSDWKTVLTSTKTDEKGHFSLEPPATGKLFYIRVSAPGMDIYELRVRIDKHATRELTIPLSVAT